MELHTDASSSGMTGRMHSHDSHPTLDNKQEPVEYTTDPVGPDLAEEALLRFKSHFTLDEIKENFKDIDPFSR